MSLEVNMSIRWSVILPLAVFLLMIPLEIPAGENEREDHEGAHLYMHRVELFLGNTHDEGEDGFSVGLAYERRLSELFGVGGIVEYTGGDFDMWLAGAPIFIHPFKGFRFLLAPGIEHKHGENEFLFRAGLAYEFEFDRWSITPEFNIDFVDGEEALVYGLSFGYGF